MPEPGHRPPAGKGGELIVLRRFLLRFCISVALAVGLLVAGECGAYYLNRHRGGGADKYGYRAYVVWQVVRPQSNIITLDVDGLRRTVYSQCDADAYTVWMLGGSGLWGHYNPDAETIPSLMAKRFQDEGRKICVKNYGQRGWASTQELIELMLELKRAPKKPDLVIFYDGTVEAFLPLDSDLPDVHLEYSTVKAKFEGPSAENAGFQYLRTSNTYLILQWIAARLGLNDPDNTRVISDEQAAAMARYTLTNYSRNMEMVDALAARFGFQYAFFWEPWLGIAGKSLTSHEVSVKDGEWKHNPGGAKVMAATYELFRSASRPHLFYLGDVFNNRRQTLFVDGTHPTGEGNQIITDKIFQTIQQQIQSSSSARR